MKRASGHAVLALLAIGVATALTEASFALGAELTFEWYVAAVACIAWWCGRTPALGAAVLASVISDFLYLPFHRLSFGMGLADGIRLLTFVGLALLVANLVAARARAEKERVGRERLLAMAAHELANMIVAQRAWTALLRRDGSSDADADRAARGLERTNHALGKLAGDLLDWPRIAAGQLDLELQDLDFADVVRDALEELREQAAARAIAVTCTIVSARVLADRDRLHQAVVNVLADSLAAVPPGSHVEVAVRTNDRRVVFSVHRSGADAPPRLSRRVLDAETSLAGAEATYALALARDLMRAQGGDVAAYGAGFRGEGTTVLMRIPISRAGTTAAASA